MDNIIQYIIKDAFPKLNEYDSGKTNVYLSNELGISFLPKYTRSSLAISSDDYVMLKSMFTNDLDRTGKRSYTNSS